jgi:hypothetical protein
MFNARLLKKSQYKLPYLHLILLINPRVNNLHPGFTSAKPEPKCNSTAYN